MGGQNSGEGRKGRCYLCRHGFDGRRHVAEVGLNPIVGPDLEVVAGAEESRHPRSGRDSLRTIANQPRQSPPSLCFRA